MASDHKEDSEDSGYTFVGDSRSQLLEVKPRKRDVARNQAEMNDSEAIKNLNDHIQILKKHINDQYKTFEVEKMHLIRRHRREIDTQKEKNEKMESKMMSAKSEMKLKDIFHKEEIQKLKAEVELLEKSEKGLRDKMNSLETKKFKKEYEKQKRDLAASKAELEKLKDKIARLERAVAEQDEQIYKSNEEQNNMAAGFNRAIAEIGMKHEEDMAAMKSDLLLKMDENDSSTKQMLSDIQKQIATGKEKEQTVEQSSKRLQKGGSLPPIKDPKKPWKDFSKNVT